MPRAACERSRQKDFHFLARGTILKNGDFIHTGERAFFAIIDSLCHSLTRTTQARVMESHVLTHSSFGYKLCTRNAARLILNSTYRVAFQLELDDDDLVTKKTSRHLSKVPSCQA